MADDEEVTVQFVISAAENSWMTEPSISGWTYGQNANEPVYAAKYGTVKVVYTGKANDGSDYNSETAPTKAGNYTATFTVAGTADYSALSESVPECAAPYPIGRKAPPQGSLPRPGPARPPLPPGHR